GPLREARTSGLGAPIANRATDSHPGLHHVRAARHGLVCGHRAWRCLSRVVRDSHLLLHQPAPPPLAIGDVVTMTVGGLGTTENTVISGAPAHPSRNLDTEADNDYKSRRIRRR